MKTLFLITVMFLLVIPVLLANDDTKPQASSSTANLTTAAATAKAPASQTITENFPRQAPTIFAPSADSTASCRNATSAGASFLTGGAALGFSRRDSECEKRAAAEAFSKIGDEEDAFFLLCQLKVARHLRNCKDTHPPETVSHKK